MRQISKRLLPDQDLKMELENLVREQNVSAGVLLSVVGSLKTLVLRVADGKSVKEWNQNFEIVSGTGTVSMNGCHIHLAAADQNGTVVGGHLKNGCIINTTAEIVIAAFDDVTYQRQPDSKTGYDELIIE